MLLNGHGEARLVALQICYAWAFIRHLFSCSHAETIGWVLQVPLQAVGKQSLAMPNNIGVGLARLGVEKSMSQL